MTSQPQSSAYPGVRTPARRFTTCRGWKTSIRRGWPYSDNRWAAMRRSTRATAIWRRNTSSSGSAPQLPITRPATFPSANMSAPTLILKGEADEWSSVELCQAMVEHLRSNSAPITLIVYPGVHHAFDVALLHPGVRYFGHCLEMRRQQRMQKKRLAHSSTPILPAHLPASRRQSDPVGQPNGPTLLVDPMPSSKRETGVRVDPLGTV